jgi:DinB family protein
MDAQEFFLEQFDTVRGFVDEYCLKELTDEQLRHQPQCGPEGLNSIAWMIWHTARGQDLGNTLINPLRKQVWNEDWMARLNVPRRDIGTGMTREECAEFNRVVHIGALRDYWDVVSEDVREVARTLTAEDLHKPVDREQLYRMLEDGTIANERAAWLPSFFEGKSRGWILSMAVWHMAEHLLGGIVCTRRISGIAIGH